MGDELREQCRRTIPQVLAQRGWELVQDEDAFIEEVLAEVQARFPNSRRPLAKIIEDATVNRYCPLWHETCGADGTLRQREAFRELHRYLYPIALYRAKYDQRVAEESTQEALIKVWEYLDRVRDPGSFARWASQIVIREVSAIQNPEEISEIDLEPPGALGKPESPLTRAAHQSGQTSPHLESDIMSDETRAQLREAIDRCVRSSQRKAVIVGLFFDQKGFKELADELQTTVENVYVLKSRTLEQLRECEEFLSVLEKLL